MTLNALILSVVGTLLVFTMSYAIGTFVVETVSFIKGMKDK